MMDDGLWYLANIIFLLGSLVREVPGPIVVSLKDNDWFFATNSNSDFRMVGYDRFFCFS